MVKIAASHDGTQVSVFFRDESVAKMTLDKAKPLTFTEGYRGREARMREYLEEQKKDDLQGLLREAKESGDVKFSICRDSIKYFGHKVEDLLPEFDEVQSLEAFWKEEILTAEQVLTF
ncbi:MAG: hypothetical protein D6704_00140 [Nitrospirae bacterium]|nr:MAG: hypothetical protein D6704_00140 [Nitrospirota bacterium]